MLNSYALNAKALGASAKDSRVRVAMATVAAAITGLVSEVWKMGAGATTCTASVTGLAAVIRYFSGSTTASALLEFLSLNVVFVQLSTIASAAGGMVAHVLRCVQVAGETVATAVGYLRSYTTFFVSATTTASALLADQFQLAITFSGATVASATGSLRSLLSGKRAPEYRTVIVPYQDRTSELTR